MRREEIERMVYRSLRRPCEHCREIERQAKAKRHAETVAAVTARRAALHPLPGGETEGTE